MRIRSSKAFRSDRSSDSINDVQVDGTGPAGVLFAIESCDTASWRVFCRTDGVKKPLQVESGPVWRGSSGPQSWRDRMDRGGCEFCVVC